MKSLVAKLKSKLAKYLTGKFLPGLMTTATIVASAKVLEFYAKAEERFPDLRHIIKLETLQDATGEIVTGVILLAVARMLGKPVRDLQVQMTEAGIYDGENEGLMGPVTKGAIAQGINNPNIRVVKGRVVRETEDTMRVTVKAPQRKHPPYRFPGGKAQ